MTRTEQRTDKFLELWHEMDIAFRNSNWFPANHFQRTFESTRRKLRAYDAKHGPFEVTLKDTVTGDTWTIRTDGPLSEAL